MILTIDDLKEHLDYNPDTGAFRWKVSGGRAAGSPAGSLHNSGCIKIQVKGRCLLGHRVAWAIMTGDWPTGDLTHLNRQLNDNRWENLALSTGLPFRNRRAKMSNETGLLGVSATTSRNRYRARIHVNGRERSLGCYATPQEAHAAYCKAREELERLPLKRRQ